MHENYFWKEDVNPLMKEAYDWMMGYFRSRDKGDWKKGTVVK